MAVSAAAAMAVTGTDTDARDYSTASWSPTTGKAYLVGFVRLDLGSAIATPTLSGNNITWTRLTGVGGYAYEPGLFVWSGYADGSQTSGSLTFSNCATAGNTCDGAIWGSVELTGTVPSSDFVVQYAANQTHLDALTTTLGSFSSTRNATCAWVASYDNASATGPALTAGSGFAFKTNNPQAMGGDGVRLAFQFRDDNDTSVDATAATANDRFLMIAVEVRALAQQAVSPSVTGALAAIRKAKRVLAPTVTAAPTITRKVKKAAAATVALAVTAARTAKKALSGTCSATAEQARKVSKALAVTAVTTATAARRVQASLAASLSSTASAARNIKARLGFTTVASTTATRVVKIGVAAAAATTAMLDAVLGASVHLYQVTLSATTAATATATRVVRKGVSAAAAALASAQRRVRMARATSVTASATTMRLVRVLHSATVATLTAVQRTVSVTFAAARRARLFLTSPSFPALLGSWLHRLWSSLHDDEDL